MNEFDAYAPPEADIAKGPAKKKTRRRHPVSDTIIEAITRLNEHLADAQAVAFDRQEVGGRLRRPTIGFIVASVIFIAAAILVAFNEDSTPYDRSLWAFAVLAGFITFVTIILVVTDLRFPNRDKPAAPEQTLKYFFRAIAMGRLGYAWATLCPTAREQTVEAPPLGEIPTGEGSYTLRSTQNLKDYAQTFARPGNGQMRTVQIKRTTLLREDGDVAIVEVEAEFTSWPQWAQIIAIVGFVFNRLLGAVLFLVLFFALRKTHKPTFRKTLIRGDNGVWYVYSADYLENVRN